MPYDAEQRRGALREFMQRHGLEPKAWCRAAGLGPNSLWPFLSKRPNPTHSLKDDTYEALADAASLLLGRAVLADELRGITPRRFLGFADGALVFEARPAKKETPPQDPALQPLPPSVWEHLINVSDASTVVVSAASLDDRLRRLIGGVLPGLSKTLEQKLFEGDGPLNTLSARINMATAMNLIDAQVKEDLIALKNLRNCFAHSPAPMGLRSEEPAALLAKFRGYKKGADPQVFLMEKLREIAEALRPTEDRHALVAALRRVMAN